MLIDSEQYKAMLQDFYKRFMPCGDPTKYEEGFMNGLQYAIRAIDFVPEADTPKQMAFDFFKEALND